ncbi:NAD(P)/FAD-dependent oxidoreductase [Acetobacter senegalensis]|uniref:flavin-containing monooxygenase n=1 Tax=Acetobacter senegalensis TaxID=446692 RepID=UPI001EDB5C13|nr:NAD(P)/FAD-dependent oxidoreductase [Acetobacter senegalensis]MCG4260622.1 NAD(P)/FAD-dependent oxidoreductase [Acetobacter senegalensis]MDN7355433.1 NAD(P)/FAD-dependent oxidoreductase [Acetobacter senegalensis]
MSVEKVETLVIGGGQAGVAMSEHLGKSGLSHLVVERNRIAERWRSERWDSLVANGPAWHDRFPNLTFEGVDPDGFASKQKIVEYFEAYAIKNNSPIRCGVNVEKLTKNTDGSAFLAETSSGTIEAKNVVVATGPFQKPIIPSLVPPSTGIEQIHSSAYRNPDQLKQGAVLVIGAGSSGAQIAEELMNAGRKVYLAVGPHDRPPRKYRGRDFVWWLGALGMWDMRTCSPSMEHVTISVSGANGGHTIDFRRLASQGMTLVGRAEGWENGRIRFAPDLAKNIAGGDANYIAMLDAADAYIEKEKLDLPEEPEARNIGPDPDCVTNPILELDLKEVGITSIVWATGYALDFDWLEVDVFNEAGEPVHDCGVSEVPGLYFLGLAWLSRRASPFIWGVWHDAKHLAQHIATQRTSVSQPD